MLVLGPNTPTSESPTCLALQVAQPDRDRGLGPFFGLADVRLQPLFVVDVFACMVTVFRISYIGSIKSSWPAASRS